MPPQNSSPTLLGFGAGLELAYLGHAGRHPVGGRRFRRPNLLAQQFPIDQAIKRGFAFFGRKRVRRPGVEQGLKSQFLFPIALQKHVAIDVGNHAIDDLTAEAGHG